MKNRRKRKNKPGGPQPTAVGQARLVGRRIWVFRLLMLALPVLVLALVELALRVAGFGYATAFLLPSSNQGKAILVQNNKFGWRFFGKRMARTPFPISIPRDKPADTTRIFVFGESAAFGDPQPAFGLPRVLQATLSLRHPERKFEIVNAAMTAINSHVIVPIARDCARSGGGDIWVVYMGNNEVVGPFGSGTVFGAQTPPLPIVRASVAIKSTRLGQFIDAASGLWRKPPPDKGDWGGMLMFVNQQVREDDPRMARVYQSYQRNLADIIHAGHDSGAGVVVSTVAVNLKDCAPFASQHRAGLSESDKQKFDDFMKLGTAAQAAGKFREAVAQYEAAAQVDDTLAELQFRLGRCLHAMGDTASAQKAFIRARDLDTLRFRCDSRLNELARTTTTGREMERVLLADAERSFAATSPDGMPGWDLFYEHVHLTFEGNCLLARTLAEQIEKLLPPLAAAGNPAGTSNPAWPTPADCARRLGRTEHDLQSALVDILARLAGAPFKMQMNHEEQGQYLTRLGRKAARDASLADALKAAHAALDAARDDPQLYTQVASLELAAGHQADAEVAARRAVELLPSSEDDWSQLGLTYVQEKKYDDAVNAFRHAFDLDQQNVWPLQNLATALAKLGRNDVAMTDYKRALAISPRFGLAWLGLGQVLESTGRKEDATNCYRKALQNPIHRAPELTTLARFCMTRGWFEPAATNYSEASILDPTDVSLSREAGEAHYSYGIELGKADKAAQAVREFQEAVRLMPEVIEARLNLGIALYQDGQLDGSRTEFEQVVARSPTNALAQHYLDLLRGSASHKSKVGSQ